MKNSNIDSENYLTERETISLADYLLILAKQIKIILITPSLFCVVAIIYVLYIAEPVYLSTAKIISSSSSGQSEAVGIAASFGIKLPGGQSEPQWVYPEIVKSRTLARSMLKRKFDTDKFGLQKPLLQILSGTSHLKISGKTLEVIAIDAIIGMIELTENIKTGVYTLNISTFEPQFSADFCNALIDELDSHQREYNTAKVNETRKFIEARILETEKELKVAEELLKDFRERNRRIENSPSLQLEQQRHQREVSVLTGVFTTLKQQLETAKIEEVRKSDYVIVIDKPEAPLNRSKPNRRFIVILAGLFGIGFGVFFAFIYEFISNSEKEEREKFSEIQSLLIRNARELVYFWKKDN